jgi:hypothetical protein
MDRRDQRIKHMEIRHEYARVTAASIALNNNLISLFSGALNVRNAVFEYMNKRASRFNISLHIPAICHCEQK